MEIVVAKTAGFCFGVDKGINMVNDLMVKSNNPIFTLGPIIHNKQVVCDLESKGVKVIKDVSEIDDLDKNSNVVIRAHGVTPDVYDRLMEKGVNIVDATCPYVKKIHRLVRKKSEEGMKIVIVGDKNHPEVIGINGWCNNQAIILNSIEEIEKVDWHFEKICVVAQTTITLEKWEEINKNLKNKFENIIKFDTICYTTSQRQIEHWR